VKARLNEQRGGVLLKIVLIALIGLVGASIAFYWYVGRQRPLEIGRVGVGWNDVLEPDASHPPGDPPVVVFESGGRIYAATFVKNTGSFPVTLDGLAQPEGRSTQMYVPVAMLRSDGDSTDPELASPAEPVALDPGHGAGVLVVYAPNPDLACENLPGSGSGGQAIASFPVRFTTYGIPTTASVTAEQPFVEVAVPSLDDCRRVTSQVAAPSE
jgi:hypothetical protein